MCRASLAWIFGPGSLLHFVQWGHGKKLREEDSPTCSSAKASRSHVAVYSYRFCKRPVVWSFANVSLSRYGIVSENRTSCVQESSYQAQATQAWTWLVACVCCNGSRDLFCIFGGVNP
jgi:hypothetical protein